jgi:hypothetical protein
MRKLILSLVLATTTMTTGHAQVVDMNKVTCGEYVALPADQSRVFAAWFSGWFSARQGHVWVNPVAFVENVGSIRQWCTTYPNEMLMAGLERAKQQAGPATGQDRLDMSLLTCKEYRDANAERREMIASWMSGYYNAFRGTPTFDFRRLANNRDVVGNYCKKRGGETLMSAIRQNAR